MDKTAIAKKFEILFGGEGDFYASAGRINLIGEHTDYNGGFVFPGAIDKGIVAEIRLNGTDKVKAFALDLDEYCEFGLREEDAPVQSWARYVFGVCRETIKRGGKVEGFDTVFSGDVPLGAGMSSSAALESTFAFALNEIFHNGIDKFELARIGQSTEHNYCGVNCGIMDQFASAQGKADHAIFLNCDTLEFDLVPVKLDGIKVVISNTHSPHKLDSGAYNARVAQCHAAVEQISRVRPLMCLAELTMDEFNQVKEAITDPVALRRAHHVVGEVQRTKDAVAALQKGDILTFGKLMNLSHESLRDDYEVTGLELDALAEAAWKVDGVIGSRMTGGGFGGCTVSLVREEAIPAFIEQVGKEYTDKTGLKADFYIAQIGDGVHRVE